MRALLANVAEIRTGIFAKPEPDGEIVYLQAKHFDELGEMASAPSPDLRVNRLTSKHLLISDDVVFAAKGSKNFAAVYHGHFPAVASTTFFVIRLREAGVLPEYLAWCLNDPTSQAFLKRNAFGSAMVSIPKTVLEDLEISIPSVEKQRQILEIWRLNKKEHELRLKIADLRRRQIQQQVNKAIK